MQQRRYAVIVTSPHSDDARVGRVQIVLCAIIINSRGAQQTVLFTLALHALRHAAFSRRFRRDDDTSSGLLDRCRVGGHGGRSCARRRRRLRRRIRHVRLRPAASGRRR